MLGNNKETLAYAYVAWNKLLNSISRFRDAPPLIIIEFDGSQSHDFLSKVVIYHVIF